MAVVMERRTSELETYIYNLGTKMDSSSVQYWSKDGHSDPAKLEVVPEQSIH